MDICLIIKILSYKEKTLNGGQKIGWQYEGSSPSADVTLYQSEFFLSQKLPEMDINRDKRVSRNESLSYMNSIINKICKKIYENI